MPAQYILRLCTFCKHDRGCKFTCPDCGHSKDMWFIRESGSQIHCQGYPSPNGKRVHQPKWFPGPVIDDCNHSGQTDDDIEPDHECSYTVPAGMPIEEVDPITEEVTARYVLEKPLELLSNNVIIDYHYNRCHNIYGHVTVCPYCRYIPDIVFTDEEHQEVLEYLQHEFSLRRITAKYHELFPEIKEILAKRNQWLYDAHDWLMMTRFQAANIIEKQLRKLPLKKMHIEVMAEERLFGEICTELCGPQRGNGE